MILIIIILLVVTIVFLTIYNMNVHKKIETYSNLNQKVVSLNILQEFMDTVSKEQTPDDKIRKINEILIEKYDIKYSTIVVYNGSEYIIKATNVDSKHWEALRNLHQEEIFKDFESGNYGKYTRNTRRHGPHGQPEVLRASDKPHQGRYRP